MKRPTFADVPEGRRRNLRAVRVRNTKPEIRVRVLLHANGYRFRLHVAGLPGRPDIVFASRRKVIEVRGCFWHRHPDPACRNAVLPGTRREWWEAKLSGNVQRDARNLQAMQVIGWDVLVVWECEVDDPDLFSRIAAFLGPPSLLGRGKGGQTSPQA